MVSYSHKVRLVTTYKIYIYAITILMLSTMEYNEKLKIRAADIIVNITDTNRQTTYSIIRHLKPWFHVKIKLF